jgi:signal transduction histidine kinase
VYQPQMVDVDGVVRRVEATLRHTIEAKKAVVTIDDLPPAWGDGGAMEQVFANLIDNALNYLDPSRPGRVAVSGRVEPGGRVTYAVTDNGVGIPRAYRAKLFNVFQRFHPNPTPGEGIGLAIVRRVLERLDGKIRVESSPGVGTTFFVTLPAAAAVAPVAP